MFLYSLPTFKNVLLLNYSYLGRKSKFRRATFLSILTSSYEACKVAFRHLIFCDFGTLGTVHEGGFFEAHLTSLKEYPNRPPKMKMISEIWHPNIDKSGDVCNSILHEPGDDAYGYEKVCDRWLPLDSIETIVVSVISLLADPNDESPASVDAAKEWRKNYAGFKKKVSSCVRKSQEQMYYFSYCLFF